MKYSIREKIAVRKTLYKRLLTLLHEKQAIHIGSCLSCMDILIETFIYTMTPHDTFIFSKGHAVPALYIVLNHLKKITDKELATFHNDGTSFPAHPPHTKSGLIPFAAGSLGHGLSFAAGIAHALQLQHKNKKIPNVYCLISDGECNEGQVWEAAQYASRYRLNNLITLIDKNKLQAFGSLDEVLGDSATVEKWKAFGFEVSECKGHDLTIISKTFKKVLTSKSTKPKVIIFNTVKGFGVSFMEDALPWHYQKLDEKTFKKALISLEKKL